LRHTGTYHPTPFAGDIIRTFVPSPLPPHGPALRLNTSIKERNTAALAALDRLDIAAAMVPSEQWFLYGFVRKEALVSSQIEGTQATLRDVVSSEATDGGRLTPDVEEVCNYVAALTYARKELAKPHGLPLCTRLLSQTHRLLMKGARGANKQPGEIRKSQNWIGGTHPSNAIFVPPAPPAVPRALAQLEKWIHSSDPLPPLVKAGLAHVQFETIHPFLDGNGRIGRLLVTLLVEHWKLLSSPLLYLSLSFKRRQQEYYQRLSMVRTKGDWEGWTEFFLDCVRQAADDGVGAARRIFVIVESDRRRLSSDHRATVPSIRLFESLSDHPVLTLSRVMKILKASKPTASKSIDILRHVGVLDELTGLKRDRIYAYGKYLGVLEEGTELPLKS
jgi:Fic family protein